MSESNTCKTCRWWLHNGGGEDGWCHRLPPVCLADLGGFLFPESSADDWCGEWAANRESGDRSVCIFTGAAGNGDLSDPGNWKDRMVPSSSAEVPE